jgi:hypothetical protein
MLLIKIKQRGRAARLFQRVDSSSTRLESDVVIFTQIKHTQFNNFTVLINLR